MNRLGTNQKSRPRQAVPHAEKTFVFCDATGRRWKRLKLATFFLLVAIVIAVAEIGLCLNVSASLPVQAATATTYSPINVSLGGDKAGMALTIAGHLLFIAII